MKLFKPDETIIKWLLEDDNPAVKYRVKTEIFGETADKTQASGWLNGFLPEGWTERTGLWSVYYLNAFAECGLNYEDFQAQGANALKYGSPGNFDCACGDFMRLRALVRLGLAGDPEIKDIIDKLPGRQLPDGGFLCLHRLNNMNRTPKSCYKANTHALMLCAECAKKGVGLEITEPLVNYFWNHNIFYKTDKPDTLVLKAREGWRAIDAFYPFEVMRVGLQNIVEAFCALRYGNDPKLAGAWDLLNAKKAPDGKIILNGTLTKSYLPRERVGKPGKWATFYALLAEKER